MTSLLVVSPDHLSPATCGCSRPGATVRRDTTTVAKMGREPLLSPPPHLPAGAAEVQGIPCILRDAAGPLREKTDERSSDHSASADRYVLCSTWKECEGVRSAHKEIQSVGCKSTHTHRKNALRARRCVSGSKSQIGSDERPPFAADRQRPRGNVRLSVIQ